MSAAMTRFVRLTLGVPNTPTAFPRGTGRNSGRFAGVLPLVVALTFWALQSGSQEWSPGGSLNAYGGANLLNDISISTGMTSFKGKPEVGYRAGLAIGYELRPWLGIEFDTGFQENSLTKPQSSSFKAMPLIMNAVFRYSNPTSIVPYVGVGGGGAVSTLDDPSGADINLVFAYQLTAGVEYELTPQLRVGALYKFFGTADQEYSIQGTSFKVKDAYSHFIGANLSWTF